MGIRRWTARAIEDGGTVRWLTGLAVTLLAEFVAAALFGLLGTAAVFLVFPAEVTRELFGSNAFVVAWLSASVGLFLGYTRWRFAADPGP